MKRQYRQSLVLNSLSCLAWNIVYYTVKSKIFLFSSFALVKIIVFTLGAVFRYQLT